jgi:AcrR family transcriptional regulator
MSKAAGRRTARRVLSPKANGTYHHGDLERALRDAAVLMLAKSDDISVRALCRELGVDARAATRYFPTRAHLLEAVIDDWHRELVEAVTPVLRDAGGTTHDRLLAFAGTYIGLAIREPNRYRVLTNPRVDESAARARDYSDEGFDLLIAEMTAGIDAGELHPGDPKEYALLAWTAMHGIASLIAARRLYVRRELTRAYATRLFAQHLQGIVVKPKTVT